MFRTLSLICLFLFLTPPTFGVDAFQTISGPERLGNGYFNILVLNSGKVVYPAKTSGQNGQELWIVDPENPDSRRQLTHHDVENQRVRSYALKGLSNGKVLYMIDDDLNGLAYWIIDPDSPEINYALTQMYRPAESMKNIIELSNGHLILPIQAPHLIKSVLWRRYSDGSERIAEPLSEGEYGYVKIDPNVHNALEKAEFCMYNLPGNPKVQPIGKDEIYSSEEYRDVSITYKIDVDTNRCIYDLKDQFPKMEGYVRSHSWNFVNVDGDEFVFIAEKAPRNSGSYSLAFFSTSTKSIRTIEVPLGGDPVNPIVSQDKKKIIISADDAKPLVYDRENEKFEVIDIRARSLIYHLEWATVDWATTKSGYLVISRFDPQFPAWQGGEIWAVDLERNVRKFQLTVVDQNDSGIYTNDEQIKALPNNKILFVRDGLLRVVRLP